jgi:sulfate/thiosulfate transport system ATP-binding protein
MSIEVTNIVKQYGAFRALDDVSLEIPTGRLVALLGPSGSGKTTLLRVIAGLEEPDKGTVLFQGKDTTHTNVRDRKVGFVFQHYALFRHMSVFENVAFGLRVRPRATRPSKGDIKDRVNELIRLVQLEGMANRLPSQLSGGQRQRVALARALAVEPQVLLLDEPFGALDARVRQELRRWLRRLHDELHVTSVFVTHDQEEALEVADTVVVMNQGKIEQIGSPEEVYDHPATPFVFNFLGDVNLFHGRTGEGTFGMSKDDVGYVRPHDLEICKEGTDGAVRAQIIRTHAVGPVVRLELQRLDSKEPFEAHMPREEFRALAVIAGDEVFARPRRLKVFPASSVPATQ